MDWDDYLPLLMLIGSNPLAPLSAHEFSFCICSENMDKIARQFDSIAELLLQLLLENVNNQSEMKIQHKESILSLCRYNHQGSIGKNEPLQNEINTQLMDHALSIHLPLGQCQFNVQSKQGSFCFDTGPDSLVVIVGKKLEVTNLVSLLLFWVQIFCMLN